MRNHNRARWKIRVQMLFAPTLCEKQQNELGLEAMKKTQEFGEPNVSE